MKKTKTEKVLRADSTLKVGVRTFSFRYPFSKTKGEEVALVRGSGKTKITVPGRMFDGFPERGWAFEEVTNHLRVAHGDPVLAWLDGCFSSVHAIRKGIQHGTYEYRWWRTRIFFKEKFGLGRGGIPFWEKIETKFKLLKKKRKRKA